MLKAIHAVAIILAAVIGWGLLAERLLWRGEPARLPLAEKGLLGFAVVTLIGLLLNFVLPLAPWVSAAVIAAGLAALAWRRRDLHYTLAVGRGVSVLAVVVVVIACALGSYSGRLINDSGLYHLQAILWQNDAPAALGLANLHGRFGFNSSWLTAAAVFNGWPFGLAGAFAVNAVITSLVLLGLFELAWPREPSTQPGQLPRVLAAVTAGFLCLSASKYLFKFSGSPTTDVAGALLTIYLFVLAANLVSRRDQEMNTSVIALHHMRLALLGILAVFAVTMKLSQLPLLLLPFGLLVITGVKHEFWRHARGAIFLAAILVFAWLGRGVWLSGCLLYPQNGTCFADLPWAVSAKQVSEELVAVKSWARAPGVSPYEDVLKSWSWLHDWIPRLFGNSVVQYLLVANIAAFGYWLWRRRQERTRVAVSPEPGMKGVVALFVWAVLALGFWFVTAPDPRFGYGYLIIFGVLGFSGLILHNGTVTETPGRQRVLIIGFMGLLAVNAGYGLARMGGERQLGWSWPVIPPPVMTTQYNHQGKPIYGGVKWSECWDLPRPCTPYFDPKLTITAVGPWPMFIGGHKPGVPARHD